METVTITEAIGVGLLAATVVGMAGLFVQAGIRAYQFIRDSL